MTFDRKMTWIKNIDPFKTKCRTTFNLMKMVPHKNSRADRNSLKVLYNSLIRSTIDYGAVIYGSAKEAELRKLNVIRHRALKLTTGA